VSLLLVGQARNAQTGGTWKALSIEALGVPGITSLRDPLAAGTRCWYKRAREGTMKITVAQCDPTVGDVPGNSARIEEVWSSSAVAGADLVVFPELFLTGYPPKDLLERAWFLDRVEAVVDDLARRTASHPRTALLFGAPRRTGQAAGKPLYNSAVLALGGRIVFEQAKSLLPTYDVFDERRYFSPANDIRTFPFQGETLAVSVCEDAWNEPELWPGGRLYTINPIAVQAEAGATLFINISASPFYAGKEELRFRLIQNHVRRHRRPFLFANQVGGNDELLFDGHSFGLDAAAEPVFVGPGFREDVRTVDSALAGTPGLFSPPDKAASVYEALVMGLRDYMRKCGFARTLIGLSGGIDSALTLAVAVGAIDELHQSLIPTRMMDWHDLLADTVGILVFTWIWLARNGSGLIARARVNPESEN